MPLKIDTDEKLLEYGKDHGFRLPLEGESMKEYRNFCADSIEPLDKIESIEIREGKGWDEIDPETMLRHHGISL